MPSRYSHISFRPPDGVRSALRRGLALHEAGVTGAGLQPDTVAWARRMAAGGSASPEKVRKMNRFFGRNARFAQSPKDSPAWASWLLWGGSAGAAWARKVVRQMDAADQSMNARVTGVCVSLASVVLGEGESPWNVLAYEVELKGRGDVRLTRRDFDEAVANFRRFAREVPVVLYHADTDATANPLSAAAHAWIVAMRVGTMRRTGRDVATLEARFRWVNDDTRAMVERGALAYGSVTLVQNATDEETGDRIGSWLWSFSLTNNPALNDIPRIAAEHSAAVEDNDDSDAPLTDDAHDKPSQDGPATNGGQRVAITENSHMAHSMMTLAARLGIAAASEDDATARIAERAQETADVRRALSLGANATTADVSASLAKLAADAAKVPALAAEVESLTLAAEQRKAADAARHIDALVAADPQLAGVRSSLEFHARADFDGFAKAYPLPKQSVPGALTTRVTASASGTPAPLTARSARHTDAAHEGAVAIMAKDPSLTYDRALVQASRNIRAVS